MGIDEFFFEGQAGDFAGRGAAQADDFAHLAAFDFAFDEGGFEEAGKAFAVARGEMEEFVSEVIVDASGE